MDIYTHTNAVHTQRHINALPCIYVCMYVFHIYIYMVFMYLYIYIYGFIQHRNIETSGSLANYSIKAFKYIMGLKQSKFVIK